MFNGGLSRVVTKLHLPIIMSLLSFIFYVTTELHWYINSVSMLSSVLLKVGINL